MKRIHIAGREVGLGEPAYLIAEGGVNHNGSADLAGRLVHAAAECGADAAKWQKREPTLHASPTKLRESCAFPEGTLVTELQHRQAMEFDADGYARVSAEAEAIGLDCFASAWDVPSVEFLAAYHPPVWKVASASVTDLGLLECIRDAARRDDAAIIMSTGMSTIEQVDAAVDVLGKKQLALLYCVSTYPSDVAELDLRVMWTLRDRYGVPVGYSGHEYGIAISAAAVAWGACIVERHITLDRTMRGSDHAASLEPQGFKTMVRDIRAIETAMRGAPSWMTWEDGYPVKVVSEKERQQAARLRRVT